MGTANRAEAFLRQNNAQQQLAEAFARFRPSDDEIRRLQTVAALALSRVARDHALPIPEEATEEARRFFDFAECGVLFGYALGVAQGAGAGD